MGGLTAFGIHVAANKVDNLSRAISDPTGCFVAGTKVPTVDGYKNIEDIEVGDQVYSENPYTGEKGYKKVVETYVKEKHTIVYLKVNNETIETTNEHPFWVEEENAFVKAEDLEVGDTLRLRDGETVTLEGIESKTSEDITKVYNFQVADWHTYYVTDMDILVHNNCMGIADSVGDVVDGNNLTSKADKYIKASLWERLTKKKVNVDKLYQNPLDDFSDPKIGPSYSAVSEYMKEIGNSGKISEPITVQKLASGGYEIVNGHHRWLAAIKSGLKKVPIRIKNYNN